MSRNNRVREYTQNQQPAKQAEQQAPQEGQAMDKPLDQDQTNPNADAAAQPTGEQQGQATGQESLQSTEGDAAAQTGDTTEQPERLNDGQDEGKQLLGQVDLNVTIADEPRQPRRGETAPVFIVDESAHFEQPSDQVQQRQTRIMKSIERDLTSYLENLHPSKAISPEHGAAWQDSLMQSIVRVINNPEPEDFKVEWSALLAFFHKHQAELFNENYMFRFGQAWKGSAKEFTDFRNLVYLAIRTANPATRKQEFVNCNFNRVLQTLSATASNNLINYYS